MTQDIVHLFLASRVSDDLQNGDGYFTQASMCKPGRWIRAKLGRVDCIGFPTDLAGLETTMSELYAGPAACAKDEWPLLWK